MKLAAPAQLLLIFFFSCKCSLHITVMLLHRQSNVLLLPQMWKLDGQSNFPSYTQLVSHLIRSWKKHQGGETPCSIWRNRLTFQVVLHVEARKKHIPVFNGCTTLQAVHDNNTQPFQSMSVWGKARLSAGGKEEMFVPQEGFTPSPHPSFLYNLAECHRGSRCGSFKCQHVNRIMEQDVLTGTSNGQKFDARNVRSDVTYSLKKKKMGAFVIHKAWGYFVRRVKYWSWRQTSLLPGTLWPRKIRSKDVSSNTVAYLSGNSQEDILDSMCFY